jgi:RNA polymerase sigma factor (TIGR02999 family)
VDEQRLTTLQPEIYAELRRIAEACMQNERVGHSLQATALVHEAWLRLARQEAFSAIERREFCAAAAVMMRRILIDHARAKATQKRGGSALQLSADQLTRTPETDTGIDLLELDDALNRLARLNERHARVVELRYFAGMTIEETALVLGVSDFTVKSDWRVARAWLISELQQD